MLDAAESCISCFSTWNQKDAAVGHNLNLKLNIFTHHSQVRVGWRGTEGICPSVLSTKWICFTRSVRLPSKWVRISRFVPCARKRILVHWSWICWFKGKRIWSWRWRSCWLIHFWCKKVGFWITGGGTKWSSWDGKRVFWGKGGFGSLCKEGICSKWVRAFEGISSEWIWWDRKRTLYQTWCKNKQM